MSEIDLIPSEHRRKQHMRKAVRYFFGVLLLLFFSVMGARMWLESLIKAEVAEKEHLEGGETHFFEQRERLEELRVQWESLREQLNALQEIQEGLTADSIFVLLDKSINDSVWLHDLRFSKGESTPHEPERIESPGYFIVLPKDAGGADWWHHNRRMEIRGQALTHADLADFVLRLNRQGEVKDVHVLNTRSVPYQDSQVIEYSVVAVLH